MRHNVAGYKLDRTKGARIALRRNLMKQFFIHERIHTTRAKAAAIRSEAEHIITIARNSANGSDSEKVCGSAVWWLQNWVMTRCIDRVFDEIAPRFENRNGGYTRVMKLGPRLGDSAEMVILELVEE